MLKVYCQLYIRYQHFVRHFIFSVSTSQPPRVTSKPATVALRTRAPHLRCVERHSSFFPRVWRVGIAFFQRNCKSVSALQPCVFIAPFSSTSHPLGADSLVEVCRPSCYAHGEIHFFAASMLSHLPHSSAALFTGAPRVGEMPVACLVRVMTI
jgi:hypothetical protein